MNAEVVPYSGRWRKQLIGLQRLLWGAPGPLYEDYFSWKYERNPYQEEPVFAVALRGTRVVGMRGIHGSRWESSWYTGALGYADDFVVLPEERGTGLARSLMTFANEQALDAGFSFVLNLSAGSITLLNSLTSGWLCPGSAGPVLRYAQPSMNSGGTVRGVRRRISRRLPDWLRHRVNEWRSASSFNKAASLITESGGIVVTTRPRIDEMASLVRRVPWDGRMRHVRDEAYLDWRLSSPLARFLFIYWYGSDLSGYLVLQQSAHIRGRLRIVDLEGESAELRASMAGHVTRSGLAPNLEAWHSTLDADVQEEVRQAGLAAYERPTAAAAMIPAILLWDPSLDGSGRRPLAELGNWDLRAIYSSLV
jgi:GNAT superfamily N-acetyltransferase